MTALKHIINWIVWTLLGLYALVMLAVQTPLVQEELGRRVSSALGDKLGTKVAIGRVDLGFLNRLILDDVLIYDLERKELLKAARVTAKIDMAPLALGSSSLLCQAVWFFPPGQCLSGFSPLTNQRETGLTCKQVRLARPQRRWLSNEVEEQPAGGVP